MKEIHQKLRQGSAGITFYAKYLAVSFFLCNFADVK